jgi:hypothetical protein
MTIEKTENEILIRLPDTFDVDDIQRMLDYLRYKDLTKDSQATQEEVDELSSEVNSEWWGKNKDLLLK